MYNIKPTREGRRDKRNSERRLKGVEQVVHNGLKQGAALLAVANDLCVQHAINNGRGHRPFGSPVQLVGNVRLHGHQLHRLEVAAHLSLFRDVARAAGRWGRQTKLEAQVL